MTDLEALLAAVIHRPADDTPRGAYADHCDDLAGVVACPRCGGQGFNKVATDRHHAKYKDMACGDCRGSGSVSNGYAERAEFVRVQVELARLSDECDVYCDDNPRRPMNALRVGVCTLHHHRRELRRRERQLWPAVWESFVVAPGCVPHTGYHPSPGPLAVVVRRGFVDELRVSLSLFVGGECRHPTCHGGHIATNAFGWRRCFHCRGTGRTPGLDLAAVFSRWPVTRVVIVGASPISIDSPNPPWRWLRATHDPMGAELPDVLFEAIPADPNGNHISQQWGRFYNTRAAALDALSAACVAYGRERAGLPAL